MAVYIIRQSRIAFTLSSLAGCHKQPGKNPNHATKKTLNTEAMKVTILSVGESPGIRTPHPLLKREMLCRMS